MAIKITRYGGPMAGMKPKTKVLQLEELDEPAKNALGALLENPAAPNVAERIPDAFVYSFEWDEADAPKKEVEVSSTRIPDALRKLLP
jgi:hypothetical protein